MNYASLVSRRPTPQSQPIPGSNQVKNAAGGYTYSITPFQQLERFLILGSERGTYYVGERELTVQNSAILDTCLNLDYRKTIDLIVDVSVKGRAPKNDPAVFALAQAAGSKNREASAYALSKINDVCRIGTHLFQFVDAVQHFRGWGRGLRDAVASWYNTRGDSQLAYQLAKYRNRNGWTHKDVLRLCHAAPNSEAKAQMFRWAVGKLDFGLLPEVDPIAIISATEEANRIESKSQMIRLIENYKLAWEMVPTKWLSDPDVWVALLPNTKLNALVRNLGRLTSNGCLKPLGKMTDYVVERLTDKNSIVRERLHPLQSMVAAKQYASGHGLKGSLSWNPIPQVINALEDAFTLGFDAVVPSGKRFLYGLDVSGSMSSTINNTSITCRDAVACLTLVGMQTEPRVYAHGFATGFVNLGITKSDNLGSVLKKVYRHDFGGTDCAVPMLYADQQKLEVDAFVVLTDNETWAGSIHPSQALERYRQRSGINAKLIVVGMTATRNSIIDPNDLNSLDVVGFDTSVPGVISNFLA